MTFPNPLLETHNSAITRVITLGITALTRTPLRFAICLVSNQHSWFYWYLPIAVWFGSLLQWCHLISCSPGDRQGPFCHQPQTWVHSQSPRGTRGVEEAAWTVQTRLELNQQEQNCNSIIKLRQRCGCTASSYVCKGKSSNLNIPLQRELVKYSKGKRPTTPEGIPTKQMLLLLICQYKYAVARDVSWCCSVWLYQGRSKQHFKTHTSLSTGPGKSSWGSQHLSHITPALYPPQEEKHSKGGIYDKS